ncbi:MAG: hypothetical protein OXU21_07295 [Chloroflexota bacterium]|nr:hypothetical protein [Chloroflexota bacterium]
MSKRLFLAAMVGALLAAFAPSVSALECDGIVLSDGCLFTATGGDTADAHDGYFVTNFGGVPMWDFVRDKSLDALGYPISQRWFEGPFTLQAFQKVILQWDPGKERMNFYNTLDALANGYPHVELPFVPAHRVLAEDQGASLGTIIRNHLAILDRNAAIKERFLSEPDWLNLYGLPISYEELEVEGNPQGVQMLRAQRTVFVLWNVPAPGTTVGRVNLQNVPDKVKQLSNVIIPDHAKSPLAQLDSEIATAVLALFRPPAVMTTLEQSAFRRLETIARNSPDVFWYLYSNYYHGFYKVRTNTRKLDLFVEVSRIQWPVGGFGRNEQRALNEIYNSRGDYWWPQYMWSLVQNPWFRDGLTDDEIRIVLLLRAFLYQLQDAIVEARQVSEEESIRLAQEPILKLLSMPFMAAIDGIEGAAIRDLFYRYLGHRAQEVVRDVTRVEDLIKAIAHLELRGGLTDDQAVLIVYSGVSHAGDPKNPGQLDIYLDPNYNGLTSEVGILIERRWVDLPYTGRIALVTARRTHGSPLSMDRLEQAVRGVEGAMRLPLPVRDVHVFLKRGNISSNDLDQLRRSYYIEIRPQDIEREWFTDSYKLKVTSEVLDYYWDLADVSGHRWIRDGAKAFAAVRARLIGSDRMRWWDDHCRADGVVKIIGRPLWDAACGYFLGASMFKGLYDVLGDEEFYSRFHNMFQMFKELRIEAADFRGVWRGDPERVWQIFQDAFLSDLDPGRAAAVRDVLHRWYY